MAKRKSGAAEIDTSEPPVIYREEADDVPPDSLRDSPYQDRHIDPKDAEEIELASSIRRVHLLQRIVVRRCADGTDEVLAGHRRKYAAIRAELALVPITRKYDVPDDVAAEMVLIENAQRKDPHPLDESAGFVRLHTTFGRSVESIATKISRPTSYVYQRLSLERLSAAGREAFRAKGIKSISLSVALELVNIRDAARQERALKEMLSDAIARGEEITIARARAIIRERYLLRLIAAPFDVRDAELVPGAPPCAACPKNSANRPQLFQDGDVFAKDDLCGDGACYKDKTDATWEKQVAEAEAKGVRVATAKELAEIFPDKTDDRTASGYVDITHGDPDTGGKPWKQVLGKERLDEVEVILVRDHQGLPRQVAKRSQVVGAIKAAPKARDPERFQPPDPKEKAERERVKAERELALEVERRVAVAAGDVFEECRKKRVDLLPFWRAFASWLLAKIDDPTIFVEVVRARSTGNAEPNVDPQTGEVIGWREVLAREIAGAEDQLALGTLIAQLALLDDTVDEKGRRLAETIADGLEIDVKAIRKQAARDARA